MSANNDKIELIKKSFELKSQKDYKGAIEVLYRALEFENDNLENAEILSQIGDLYLFLGNNDKALDEFQKALSYNNTHLYSVQKCFDIYFETGEYKKALNIIQKTIDFDKSPTSYFNYLKTLYKLEKYDDILAIFNSLDESIKLDVNILYLISKVNIEKKELLLKKIVELDETHTEANLELARIAFDNRDYQSVYKYCANLDIDLPIVSYYQGIIEYHHKNYSKAIENIIKAINQDDDKNDYYFDLAKIYVDILYYTEAILCLKQSINFSLINNKKENLDEKYFLIGWLFYKQNNNQTALLNLNMVKENSNFYTISQIIIQAINLKQNNLSEAKNKLEKLFENEKNNHILLDTLAMVYKKLKMPNKAIEIYSKALNLYPNSIYYKLELIDLYIDVNLYSKASALIEEVNAVCKNCASVHNSLARIYYRLKDYSNALNSIEDYLKLDSNNSESYYFKGLILNDIKNYEEARNSIYTAIKLNPNVAKYYSQMARSYFESEEYENALLYTKEAIEIDENEINYKKQAYEIAQKLNNKEQIKLFERQLKRSEKIIKSRR